MTDDKRERISALLDDEIPTEYIIEAIDQIQKEDYLRETWRRYQLIGDLMRGEVPVGSSAGVANSVKAEMKSVPAVTPHPLLIKPRRWSRKRWPRHIAGGLLAASVAALSVILLPRFTISSLDEPEPVRVAVKPNISSSMIKQTGTYWENLDMKKVESKLNRYLMEHNEFASPTGMQGVLPYASFVAYDQNR